MEVARDVISALLPGRGQVVEQDRPVLVRLVHPHLETARTIAKRVGVGIGQASAHVIPGEIAEVVKHLALGLD